MCFSFINHIECEIAHIHTHMNFIFYILNHPNRSCSKWPPNTVISSNQLTLNIWNLASSNSRTWIKGKFSIQNSEFNGGNRKTWSILGIKKDWLDLSLIQ